MADERSQCFLHREGRNLIRLIARAKDRESLIQSVCDELVKAHGFHNAWIALPDEQGRGAAISESGPDDTLKPMLLDHLGRGELTECARGSLAQSGVHVTEDPNSSCTGCPIAGVCEDGSTLTARLEHEERVFGILGASIPKEHVHESEQGALFLEVARDIAHALHRIEVEGEREKNVERFILAAEVTADLIYEWDVNTDALEWFGGGDEALGYAPGELPRSISAWINMIHPDDLEGLAGSVELHRTSTGTINEEYRIKSKSGEWRYWEARGVPVLDDSGKPCRWIGACSDITASKKAELALRESESRLRSIFDAAESISLIVTDLKGEDAHIIEFNRGAEKIFGYEREEAIGKPVAMLHLPEDVARFPEVMDAMRKRKDGFTGENTLVRKSGERFPALFSTYPIFDSKGEMTAALGLSVDLSERKAFEESSRRQQRQLFQADKMISLGTLVSGVAHEINNPNHFIMSHTYPLIKAWQQAEPILAEYNDSSGDFMLAGMPFKEARERIPEMFDSILKGSTRIKAIVKELRDYTMVHPSITINEIQINHVVKSAITLLSNMIKRTTDHFSIEYGKGMPGFMGNYQRMEQVVINLVQNACQALTGKEKAIRVSTTYDEQTESVLLKVQDEGVGISRKDIHRITDPFFTTKRGFGGTGLGLSISSTIVMEHHGKLTFSSVPDKGTVVTVAVPRVSDA